MIDRPVVLTVNSADCSGATGLSADICTIATLGAHPAPVTSVVIARDTQGVRNRYPMSGKLIIDQLRAVLEDSPVTAIKLGDTGDTTNAEAIHTVLQDYAHLPLILDPHSLTEDDPGLLDALRYLLLPRVSALVICAGQASVLSNTADSYPAYASELMDAGCRHVLMTGVDHDGSQLRHQLFSAGQVARSFAWDCLPDRPQGISSTLSAALAAYIAWDMPIEQSCEQALAYTCQAMSRAYRAGMGRMIPNRLLQRDNAGC